MRHRPALVLHKIYYHEPIAAMQYEHVETSGSGSRPPCSPAPHPPSSPLFADHNFIPTITHTTHRINGEQIHNEELYCIPLEASNIHLLFGKRLSIAAAMRRKGQKSHRTVSQANTPPGWKQLHRHCWGIRCSVSSRQSCPRLGVPWIHRESLRRLYSMAQGLGHIGEPLCLHHAECGRCLHVLGPGQLARKWPPSLATDPNRLCSVFNPVLPRLSPS